MAGERHGRGMLSALTLLSWTAVINILPSLSAFTFKSSSLAVGIRESAVKREVLLIAGAISYSGVGVISLLSKVNGRQPHFFIYLPEQQLTRSNTNKSAVNISIAAGNSQRQVLKLVIINQPKVS